MALVTPVSRGSTTAQASASQTSVTLTGTVVVGKVIVVICTTDNTGTVDGSTNQHTSCADIEGNTYTKISEITETDGSAGDGSTTSIWWSKITVELTTSSAIGVNHGTVTARAAALIELGLTNNTDYIAKIAQTGSAVASGSTPPTVSTSSLTSREYCHIYAVGAEGGDSSKSPPTNFTELIDVRTGTSATASVSLHVAYRINTTTGESGSSGNWTGTSFVAFMSAFYEVLSRVAVGQTTETDTSGAIGKQKRIAVGQVTETETSQSFTVKKIKSIAVGQVTETDTSVAIGNQKRIPVGQVTETNAAQIISVGGAPSIFVVDSFDGTLNDQATLAAGGAGLGQSFTNDTECILYSVKFNLLNAAPGTGTLTVSIYEHTGTYGTSSNKTGSALASATIDVSLITTSAAFYEAIFAGANKITLAASTYYVAEIVRNSDGDSSAVVISGNLGATPNLSHDGNIEYGGTPYSAYDYVFYIYGESGGAGTAIGQVNETDTSQAVSSKKQTAVVQSTGTETSQTVGKQKRIGLNQATETELSQSVGKWKRLALNQTTETDTLQSIGKQKRLSIGQLTTTNTAQSISVSVSSGVSQVVETDTSQAIGQQKRLSILQTSGTDLSQSVGKQKRIGVVQIIETEVAQAVGKTKRIAVAQAAETNQAQTISVDGVAPFIVDSYDGTLNDETTLSAGGAGLGQSFTNDVECILYSAKFCLKKATAGTGTLTVSIYEHTGTYGTSSNKTGSALASATIDVSLITSSPVFYEAIFTGLNKITLAASTYYVVEIVRNADGDSSSVIVNGNLGANPNLSHDGNIEYGGTAYPAYDYMFYVYGESGGAGNAVGQSVETDLSQAVGKQKRLAVSQTTETDQTQTVSVGVSQQTITIYPVGAFAYLQDENGVYLFDENGVPLYVEAQSDFAQVVTAQKVGGHNINVIQVTSTNTSQAVGKQKRPSVLQATNANLSQSIGKQKRISVGQVVDSNDSVAVAPARKKPVGQTTESDSSGQLEKIKRCALNTVTNPNSALSISTLVAGVVQPAIESDTSQSIVASKRIIIGQTVETNFIDGLTARKQKLVRQVNRDVITNGAFDTNLTGWTFELDPDKWAWDGGVAACQQTSPISQVDVFVIGNKYKVSFELKSNYQVRILNGLNEIFNESSIGAYEIEFYTENLSLTFFGLTGAKIDNVVAESEVAEVSQPIVKKKLVQFGGSFLSLDSADSIQPIKRVLVNQVVDTNLAGEIIPMGVFGQVAETDQALSIQSRKRKSIYSAVELDFGLQLFTILKKFNITLVNEHDNCVFISKPGDEIIDVGMVVDFNKAFPTRLFDEEEIDVHDLKGIIIDRMPEGETFDFPLKVSYANKHNLTAYLVDADGKYFIDADGKQFLTADLVLTNESIKGEIL